MKCRSVRVRADTSEDGRPVVSLVLSNMRRVGSHDEEAWTEMSPGMAREIATNLIEVAAEIEKNKN